MFNKIVLKPYIILPILMLMILIIDNLTGRSLSMYGGIIPRETSHFKGVLLYSFLHSSWGHFVSNMGPFILIGFFMTKILKSKEFLLILLLIGVCSGLGVWFFGAPQSIHVGASGVIFGMWSFLMTLAIKRREFKDVLIGSLVGIYYGLTFMYGLMPREGISFTGHLFGFASGIFISLSYIKLTKEK